MIPKPWYQQLALAIVGAIAGLLLLGAVLGSITNAIALIPRQLTFFGSVALLAMAVAVHCSLRRWPLRWVVRGGSEVRLSGLGRKSIFGLAGALFLLWIPYVLGWFRGEPEHLVVYSERVNDDYPTEFRHEVSVSRTMPGPAFVLALWDVTVINNGQRDVSLVGYTVRPLGDLPRVGPYYEPYDQGIVNVETNDPVKLPVNLAVGHAFRFRVRSFIVVPANVAIKLRPQIPWKTTLGEIFFNFLYAQGIDCFGNEVSPGPGGYHLLEHTPPMDQQLQFNIRTGRGTTLSDTLTWYKGPSTSEPWPHPQRPTNPTPKE